ncbi:hypothetical protein [Paenibacillus polymyxa]|uniref:hypothetical protein n=1 Tax=Paenibacillus polymyxa TaxID=1406 RepID=UPI0023789C76|nr:hypothetical protein [Paenibacillus polymyxa]WDM21579.1 hypothetical protein J4I02_22090 [Paenibacillus polymyxa]
MKIEIYNDRSGINVNKIDKEIRDNINKKSYKDDFLAEKRENKESDLNFILLEEYSILLERTWYYQANTPLASKRRITGSLIVFIKKCIRFLLGWYVNPIVQKQTEFNANVVKGYNELIIQLKNVEQQMKDSHINRGHE